MPKGTSISLSHLDSLATKIAAELWLKGVVLCSFRELKSEATLHLLEALASFKAPPPLPAVGGGWTASGYAYRRARFRTIDYIRRVTHDQRGRRPRPVLVSSSLVDLPGRTIGAPASDYAGRETLRRMSRLDWQRLRRLLSDRERGILEARSHGETYDAIGQRLSLSGARVCQLAKRAEMRLSRWA